MSFSCEKFLNTAFYNGKYCLSGGNGLQVPWIYPLVPVAVIKGDKGEKCSRCQGVDTFSAKVMGQRLNASFSNKKTALS